MTKEKPRVGVLVKCQLCGMDANVDVQMHTVMGAVYGPRLDLIVKYDCQNDACRFVSKTSLQARDRESFERVSAEIMRLVDQLPTLGRWTSSKLTSRKSSSRAGDRGEPFAGGVPR